MAMSVVSSVAMAYVGTHLVGHESSPLVMGDCSNVLGIEDGECAVMLVIQDVGDIGLGKHSILHQVPLGEVILQIFDGYHGMLH